MATDAQCAALYGATTNLAYTVNQLARTPRPPFDVPDQGALTKRSTDIADAARDFRGWDPGSVDGDALVRAGLSVKSAQVMVDTVNLELNNRYTKGDIYPAIDTAVADVRATYATRARGAA